MVVGFYVVAVMPCHVSVLLCYLSDAYAYCQQNVDIIYAHLPTFSRFELVFCKWLSMNTSFSSKTANFWYIVKLSSQQI